MARAPTPIPIAKLPMIPLQIPFASLRKGRYFGQLSLAAAALLGAFAFATGGQEAKDTAKEDEDADLAFGESLDIQVVNVEVYVTDKDGKRVLGLTKDDFVLTVDKKPMAISNFYVVEGGTPRDIAPPAAPAEPEVPAQIPAPPVPTAAEVPDEQKLHMIVYIDNYNLRPFSRNRVISAARSFLRSRLRPGDEVMLMTFDRKLKVRHPFTSDPELIANALYELEDITGFGVHYDSDRKDILDMIYNDSKEIYDVQGRVITYAESIFNDMSYTLNALTDQVDMLAGLPGRKAILYVSDGISLRPAEDIFYALNDKFHETGILADISRFDLSRRYDSLVAQANANRVTFYTVDAAGLRSYSYLDASNQSVQGGAMIDQTHFANIQTPLRMMAEETGGFAIVNTNNFSPMLDRMAEDFSNYYSLGFSPASSTASGRYHTIKVELKNKVKGRTIRYREGYRDRPVDARMADSALAALNFGYVRNPMGVLIESGRAEVQNNGQFLVPFLVKIPIGKLTFLQAGDMQRTRVRLYVAAKDDEGGMAEVQQVPLPIDIPNADFARAQDQFYQYRISLMMRKGGQVLSIGVRDEIGATTSVATHALRVGG
jgi:VWFA-related protein